MPRGVLAVLVALVVAAGGALVAVRFLPQIRGGGRTVATGAATTGPGGGDAIAAGPFRLTGSSPADGGTVDPAGPLTLTFSRPIDAAAGLPTIQPALAGRWQRTAPDVLAFLATGPLPPGAAVTVSVPAGAGGVRAADGAALAAPAKVTFQVQASTVRLQQLLAQLGYLPLSFTPAGPAPGPTEMDSEQPGSFAWRWTTLPPDLTGRWEAGAFGEMTKAAIMGLEHADGLAVDGIPGPAVWSALDRDVVAGHDDPNPYSYVLVSKQLPETLTLWVDGNPQYQNIPVNTGVHGADTTDGTYAVFEHVPASEMKGTNPDGSTYDDPAVPWASFFNGGDALHGFDRPSYGSPQSNGCVEMPIATAGQLWPLTPIGTLVTVTGPSS